MRRRLRDERGVVALEFAILLPVLLLLILGIIQIGIFIFTMTDVRQATRQGGRLLTVSRNDSNALTNVESKVAASVGSEVTTSKLTYTFSSPPPWAPGTVVKMTVTYPTSLSVLGLNITNGPITASATVTVE